MSLLGQGRSEPTRESRPRLQVKVGKSQRAALTVDVELGTVAITKKGSGSPEEIIPHDKSKGLMTPPPAVDGVPQGCGIPWHRPDARVMGCRPPVAARAPIPRYLLPPRWEVGSHRCPPHALCSVLQLIKYQSMQSKVRLVYDREPQRSLSRDFVFPSARVRGSGCAHWASWGNTELFCSDAANKRSQG